MARRSGSYLLYDMALRLVALALAPWVFLRSFFSLTYRKGALDRLGFVPTLPPHARVLLHGVSVGEVRAMRPLVDLLQQKYPELQLVVSSTTTSGRDMAERLFPGLKVVRFPVDLRSVVARFLKRIRPSLVILIELEIWPNFLRACDEQDVPVAILNGRITEHSIRGYRRVHRFLPQFDRIALYGVQNELYAQRFKSLKVPPDRVLVTGNLKYDCLPEEATGPASAQSELWSRWTAGQSAVALASTHSPEERLILSELCADPRFDEMRIMVVPRHPSRSGALRSQLQALAPQRKICLRSTCDEQQPLPESCVLIVDTFGELEEIYRVSLFAFVGGSLIPHGGQNFLEPIALGTPVLAGPHLDNFLEESRVLASSPAFVVANEVKDLLEFAGRWAEDPHSVQNLGKEAIGRLQPMRGASRKGLEALESFSLIPESPHPLKND